MKNVVITGVSSGIGMHLTTAFVARGYRVFGSVRKMQDAKALCAEFGEMFHPLVFDVTDHEHMVQAVGEVQTVIGKEGLSGLVNNAGVAVSGPVMHLDVDDFRHQFEVNFFGVLAITKACLPLLGAVDGYDKTPGKIVNISSVSGKIGFPFLAPYCASKFALEGFSEALRRELLIYGIDVLVIGPGAIKTPIWKKSEGILESDAMSSVYAPALTKFAKYATDSAATSMEPDVLAAKVLKVFESKSPAARYAFMKKKFSTYIIPGRFLTPRQFDRIIGRIFSLKKG
jgi:NAD(P)-dependent dehydrogenase (short-subunit alcohol dehydrogenase family)